MKKLKLAICLLAMSSTTFATTNSTNSFQAHPIYVSVNAGIFKGNFNSSYTDLTDVYQQNISQSVQQNGYTEGFALGYSKLLQQQYLVGVELSANFNSQHANLQAGTSIADTTQIKNNIDLTFVPGILLNNSLAAYLKLGVSRASLQDKLTSPAGFSPVVTNFNSSPSVTGFAAGLGIKKFITEHVAIFTEGNYHDYGTVNFSQFQNFMANYSHSSRVYSYSVVIGASYHI